MAYERVSSGTCKSLGMELVRYKRECDFAATKLGLSDTTASSYNDQYVRRPHGCIYASNDWLQWNDLMESPNASVPCGTRDGIVEYDCLCIRPG